MERKPMAGDSIVYIDSYRQPHNALVTEGWSETCVNLVLVSSNESERDSYGRQLDRQTSCVHRSCNSAGANCWIWPGE